MLLQYRVYVTRDHPVRLFRTLSYALRLLHILPDTTPTLCLRFWLPPMRRSLTVTTRQRHRIPQHGQSLPIPTVDSIHSLPSFWLFFASTMCYTVLDRSPFLHFYACPHTTLFDSTGNCNSEQTKDSMSGKMPMYWWVCFKYLYFYEPRPGLRHKVGCRPWNYPRQVYKSKGALPSRWSHIIIVYGSDRCTTSSASMLIISCRGSPRKDLGKWYGKTLTSEIENLDSVFEKSRLIHCWCYVGFPH